MESIRKIKVSTGIYWIEVPEKNIYILCGCPADTVKHLMRRGLIVPTEVNGAKFETGPNIILLSDLMIQHGNFSNMAEFPVLQMFYRQGMIIPNHPNNIGQKPTIIGLPKQINAQMEYIRRGNYGLVSEEEIMEAGLSNAEAKQLMRMKLRFAFGKISATEEFIESVPLEEETIEVRDGLMLTRTGLNKFRFDYKEQSVDVDLNLSKGECYKSPYPIGYHKTNREYFSVIHSGEGDGWDVNRPSMSSIVMYHGKIYLIDAGPNINETLRSLGIGINEIEGIFHTHSHDDHFAGLTSLIRADKRIKYYATPLVHKTVTKKIAALLSIKEASFSSYFDVHFLQEGAWNNVGGLDVRPIMSPHPVETNIFFFRALGEWGYRTYAHFADIISIKNLKSMVTSDDSKAGISQATYDTVVDEYLTAVDLKKLDIGGGMIHGNAEDFTKDGSGRLVLSHTAEELTGRQKEIGSGAPFGTVDSLITAYKDYDMRFAFEFMHGYFPSVEASEMEMLLNNKKVEFNPESLILKRGEVPEYMYVILNGNVDLINSSTHTSTMLYSGTLVGEIPGLFYLPSEHAYRAASFVKALRVPCSLFKMFVEKHNLHDRIERQQTIREYMMQSELFNEGLSFPVQNQIANMAELVNYEAGSVIEISGRKVIYNINSGVVERRRGNKVVEILVEYDFFGEEDAISNITPVCNLVAAEDCWIYEIPAATVNKIPIIMWKLFEANERRRQLIQNEEC